MAPSGKSPTKGTKKYCAHCACYEISSKWHESNGKEICHKVYQRRWAERESKDNSHTRKSKDKAGFAALFAQPAPCSKG